MQVSTFGIMPPAIVPSAISRRASSTESCLISCFDLSSTPGTSVSKSSRFALSAPAFAAEDLRQHRDIDLLGLADEAELDDLFDVGIRIGHGAPHLARRDHVAVLA